MVLPLEFYKQDTVQVAKQLLGKFLVCGKTAGKIVETEAYIGTSDLASHSYRGQTQRNAVMFGPAGRAYVYFTYGMHYCFNAVTEGAGEAVLIRALEPTDGIQLMRRRRRTDGLQSLCSGPAKLVQALGITSDMNGTSLADGPIRIEQRDNNPIDIAVATRIGISRAKDELLRFYITNNQFISRK